MPLLEINFNLLQKLESKFDEESTGESSVGFLLSQAKNNLNGSYCFWELCMAEDKGCTFSEDFYPIQRVEAIYKVRCGSLHKGIEMCEISSYFIRACQRIKELESQTRLEHSIRLA